jgi:Methyltransferase domain
MRAVRIDREQLVQTAEPVLRRLARRLGWHLVRADFYSPIIDPDRLPDSTWERRTPMPGLELDLDGQLELLQVGLAPFACEWRPPLNPPGDQLGFHLDNPYYGPLDADVLYGMVRHLRPARVLELGSGYSTLVIEAAAALNAAEGVTLSHTVVDPFMSPLLSTLEDEVRRLEVPAQSLPPDEFESLQAGDVLFVDSTHTVKPGGDVVFVVLEALGMLAPGVVVHFHDIFRPFEYPRLLSERFNKHWQEHHLLQAFLAYNPGFRVLCANHALARLEFDRAREFAPALRREMAPSGFWIEKL